MYCRALPILAVEALAILLVARANLSAQSTPAPHSYKSSMHHHYDAAYRFQASGDTVRADVEHKRFLAAALDHQANFYANTGDYLHAAPIYDEALQLIPSDVALLMDYTGASLDAHNPKKARVLLQIVTGLDSASMTSAQKADVHLMSGKALWALGDTKAAVEEFHAAIALEPNAANYDVLADAVLKLNGLSGAAPVFAKIIVQFGDSAAVHMRIGRIYAVSAYFDRAIDEFKKAIALDSKIPDVHYSLGAAYMSNQASDLPLAESEFRKELAIHPNDTFTHQQLGYIALRRRDYREAEIDFKRALAINPLNADIFADLGKLYTETKHPAEAEIAFRQAIGLTSDPAHNAYAIEGVHYRLGRLLIARGDETEGQKELQTAQDLLSQRALQVEATLSGEQVEHSSLERTRVATPKEMLELNTFTKEVTPLIAGSYNNLGVHAAMGERYADAAGYFKLAAKWDPGLTGVERNWGKAAFAAHDCGQAIEPLRRALASDLSNTELSEMLEQCQKSVR